MDEDKYTRIIEALRAKASEILPHGSCLSLYGSRARGDARPDSDWDIHILIPGAEHLSLDEIDHYAAPIENIGWEFDEFFCARVYSVAGWLKRSFLPFYKNVERDKVIIYQN